MNPPAVFAVFVGTTLGPASDAVVEAAIELARRLGARVHLRHALPREPTEALRDEFNRRLRAQGPRLGLGVDELGSLEARVGRPDQLLRDAGSVPNAVLVVGRREAGGWLDAPLGANTRRLARSAPCPLWVVRGPLTLSSARVVVCAPRAESSPAIESWLRAVGVREDQVSAVEPGMGELARLEASRPDLLVVRGARRRGLGSLLERHRVERLVGAAPAAALVVPA